VDPSLILAALIGSGGTGLVPLVWKFFQDRRHGKVENTRVLADQLEAQALRDMQRANVAEERADEAEKKQSMVQLKLWSSEEYCSRLRMQLIELGHEPVRRGQY
jgi:hypothetical protein